MKLVLFYLLNNFILSYNHKIFSYNITIFFLNNNNLKNKLVIFNLNIFTFKINLI